MVTTSPLLEAQSMSAYAAWKSYLVANRMRIDLRSMTLSTLNNPQSGNWPDLQGKAHDCRMCVSWLAFEFARAFDAATPHGQRRASLAWIQQDDSTFEC